MTQPEKGPYVYIGSQGPTREQVERDFHISREQIAAERRVSFEDPFTDARREIEDRQRRLEEQLGLKLAPRLVGISFTNSFSDQVGNLRRTTVSSGEVQKLDQFLKTIVYLPRENNFKGRPWISADYYMQRVSLSLTYPVDSYYPPCYFRLDAVKGMNTLNVYSSGQGYLSWGKVPSLDREAVLWVKFGKTESAESRFGVFELPVGWEEKLFDEDWRYRKEAKVEVAPPEKRPTESPVPRVAELEARNLELDKETIKKTVAQLGKDLGVDLLPYVVSVRYSVAFQETLRLMQDVGEHFVSNAGKKFKPEDVFRVIICLPGGVDPSEVLVDRISPGSVAYGLGFRHSVSFSPAMRVNFKFDGFPSRDEVGIANAQGNCGSWGRDFQSDKVMFVGFDGRGNGRILCRTIFDCDWKRKLFAQNGSFIDIEEAPARRETAVSVSQEIKPEIMNEEPRAESKLNQEAEQIMESWGTKEGFDLIKRILAERTKRQPVLAGQPLVGRTEIDGRQFDLHVREIVIRDYSYGESKFQLCLVRAEPSDDPKLRIPVEESQDDPWARKDIVWQISFDARREPSIEVNCWREEVGPRRTEIIKEGRGSLKEPVVIAAIVSGLRSSSSFVHIGGSSAELSGSSFEPITGEQIRDYLQRNNPRTRGNDWLEARWRSHSTSSYEGESSQPYSSSSGSSSSESSSSARSRSSDPTQSEDVRYERIETEPRRRIRYSQPASKEPSNPVTSSRERKARNLKPKSAKDKQIRRERKKIERKQRRKKQK